MPISAVQADFLASSPTLELAVPHLDRGIGDVVLSPDSPKLICGVRIQPLAVWPDDRGFFLEILRSGQSLTSGFPAGSTQVSAALSYSGAIKALHFHLEQTDAWTAVNGMFQFVLIDLRKSSPTFGRRNTLYCGSYRPWQVLIPPGVGHGYKVIGPESGLLVYATDRFYNPNDEGRIPHNDPRLNYDWETQYK